MPHRLPHCLPAKPVRYLLRTVSRADLLTFPEAAERVTYVFFRTRCVRTVTVTLVAPDGTVIVVGRMVVLEPPSDSVTTAPPAGAGALRAITALDAAPPATLAGVRVSAATAAGCGVGAGAGGAAGARTVTPA